MIAKILHQKIEAAGIPFEGVAIGDGSYRIDFLPEATQEQRDRAAAIVAAFDPVAEVAAYEAAVAVEKTDLAGLLPKVTTELSYIDTTLLSIDSMTATQVRSVVKRILQEQQAELKAWRYVIRQLTGKYNGA